MENKATVLRQAFSILLITGFFAGISSFSVEAEAARKKTSSKQKKQKKARAVASAPTCDANIAATTMYYVPHIKDFCKGTKPCASFKDAVQNRRYGAGTGTLYNGSVLRYNNKVESLPPGCSTAVGARGTCLTPFISVAADPRYHRMGDYISMPALKGQVITMPDGRQVEHPGFLIVEDVGGAIKGANRFDFFTGAFGMKNPKNAFGVDGLESPKIASKNSCSDDKRFRKVDENTTDFIDAQEDIAKFMDQINPSVRNIAAAQPRSSEARR